MKNRVHISTGTAWEDYVGYSRAFRIGKIIEVSGTVAADENGHVVGKNNPYEQTRHILSIIRSAIEEAGGELTDVVRTRIYVTDMNHWKAIGKAHGEVFHEVRPASTLVQVNALVGPDFLVEIEATAIMEIN